MTAAIDGAGADFTCAGGAVHRCVWPVGAALVTTAGPDVVREAGPDHEHGFEHP